LGGDGGRALLARRLHELVAVGGEPLDGDEERARPRLARVVRHGGDGRVAVPGEDRPGQARGQLAEVHGISPSWRTHVIPASMPAPASGACFTTRPDPRSSTMSPRRAAEVAPSRAEVPRRSGIAPDSP